MNLSVEFKKSVFELIKTLIKEFVTLFSDELISSLETELFDRLISNTQLFNLSANSEVAENDSEPETEVPVDLSTNQHSNQQQRDFNLNHNLVSNDDLESSVTKEDEQEQVQEHLETNQMVADDNKFAKMATQATQTEPESALEAESELLLETEQEETPLDAFDAVGSQTEQSTSIALPSTSFDAAICEFAIKSEFIDEDEIVFIETPATQLDLPANESPVANLEPQGSEHLLSNDAQAQLNDADLNEDVSHSENAIATTDNTSGIKRKISHIESDDAHLSKTPKTNSTTPTIASTPSTETMPNNSASSTLVCTTIASASNLQTITQANLPKSNALAETNEQQDDDYNDDDDDDDDKLNCLYDRWSNDTFHSIEIIKIKCPKETCQKLFPTKDEYEKHLLSKHNIQPFFCLSEACKMSFSNITEWNKHTLEDHCKKGRRWKCRICLNYLVKPKILFKHHISNHEKGIFVCKLCRFKSNLRKNIIKHLQTNICKHKPTMDTKFAIKKHCEQEHSNLSIQQIQSNNAKISCPFAQCKAKFNFKNEMAQHLQNAHKISTFKCFFIGCKRNFRDSKHLDYHIYNEHRFVKNWICFFCKSKNNQTFSSHTKLLEHIHLMHFENIFLRDYQQNDFEEPHQQFNNFDNRQISNFNANFNQSIDSAHSSQHQNVHLMTNLSSYQHQNVSSMTPETQEAYLLELQQSFLNGPYI